MSEFLTRFMEDMVGRVHGTLSFRIVLQPLMAVLFAVRDGRKDAREGKPPYAWAVFTDADHRRELLQSGWKSSGRICLLALVLDAVYQYLVAGRFYPGEALAVAVLLALLPYLLLRGPISRLSRNSA